MTRHPNNAATAGTRIQTKGEDDTRPDATSAATATTVANADAMTVMTTVPITFGTVCPVNRNARPRRASTNPPTGPAANGRPILSGHDPPASVTDRGSTRARTARNVSGAGRTARTDAPTAARNSMPTATAVTVGFTVRPRRGGGAGSGCRGRIGSVAATRPDRTPTAHTAPAARSVRAATGTGRAGRVRTQRGRRRTAR